MRLRNSESEIASYKKYDYTVINDDLDDAYKKIKSIILAEKLKTKRINYDYD